LERVFVVTDDEKKSDKSAPRRLLSAIKVRQWLDDWDTVKFSPQQHRKKPLPHFYVFSMPAAELRSLCGISRRQTSEMTPRAADLGIQRQHDPDRSDEIAQFVEYGFPWSTLSEAKRKSNQFNNFRKPGWLPTAIVINILESVDERDKARVDAKDVVTIEMSTQRCAVRLPYEKWTKNWRPSKLPPFEIIDGQHRLFAFGNEADEDFELPVVAFHGLDISWQAYLFWTINIKPKRINPSLAFDLYPLLRGEDWLDQGEGHPIYRETRSQELTEALWSHPESPWYDKINMLGEPKIPWVSQSAWIKSLMATLVRPWQGRGAKLGGLYGSRLADDEEVLGWSRAQQAAFLIYAWRSLHSAVQKSKSEWAVQLRAEAARARRTEESKIDPAFYGEFSLIKTDQGVRGYLHVLNDICFISASQLKLRSWRTSPAPASDSNAVTMCLQSLRSQPVAEWLVHLSGGLATFDWRTSATTTISEEIRRSKLVFRGSGGYKELRLQLLEHLASGDDEIGRAAAKLQVSAR
jgi:DGQHR domain-containing protein